VKAGHVQGKTVKKIIQNIDNPTRTANEDSESHQHTETGNTTNHGYNLQPRPTKQHEKLNLMQVTQQSTYVGNEKPHLHVMMMQMSVKAGIKKFGEEGNDAVSNDRKAMVPILKDDLLLEDKQKALRYLMFIKEKRDGEVKARGCADGRPQWQ